MKKKIKLESFKYRFLVDASKLSFMHKGHNIDWNYFLENLNFEGDNEKVTISWREPLEDSIKIDLKKFIFYGNNSGISIDKKNNVDNFQNHNAKLIKKVISEIIIKSNFLELDNKYFKKEERNKIEEKFHDEWAKKTSTEEIDVIKSNEVCTAPEMRYITKKLGSLKNKQLLDIGCGLGEASVYFAIKGAHVTSLDLSSEMLKNASNLASINNVKITTKLASAEEFNLPKNLFFDIIYAGNLLHHVDICETLEKVIKHMKPGSKFISWDPIEYNPIINIYRMMAKDVRTPDEHPIRKKDLKNIKQYFKSIEVKYFWFFTLLIFIFIFIFQKKNPNKVRFWKLIIKDGHRWKWLYNPLEKLDQVILKAFPFLKWLCWNIVIIGYK